MSLLTNLFRGVASAPMGALKLATRGRTGQATAAVAGGFLASSYLSHLSGVKKNYYGEKEYQSQYRGGIDTAASLAPYAGGAMGLSMLFGASSIPGRILNTTVKIPFVPGSIISNKILRAEARAKGADLVSYGTSNIRGPNRTLLRGAEKYERATRGIMSRPGIMPLALVNAASATTSYLGLKATSAMMAAPGTTAAVVGGVAAATAMQKAAWYGGAEGLIGIGAIGAAATAGVYIGSRLPMRSAGEGYISDFRVNAQSTSGKMDFNTAGLVQAMHYNRRG